MPRLSSQLFTHLQPFNLFVGEGRASNPHATDFCRRNKLGNICDGKIPLLNRWEELFESAGTAWRNDHREMNGAIIGRPPGMGNARPTMVGFDVSAMRRILIENFRPPPSRIRFIIVGRSRVPRRLRS